MPLSMWSSAKVAGEAKIAKSMALSHVGRKTFIIYPQVSDLMGFFLFANRYSRNLKLPKMSGPDVNFL